MSSKGPSLKPLPMPRNVALTQGMKMPNEIHPPNPEDSLFFNEKVLDEVAKGVDRGIKYAKVAIILIVVLSSSLVGLISWVVIHFIIRSW